MLNVSKERSRRLVAIHGWSAVVFGLFLYVVVLTGAIAVLSQEISVWSAGGKLVAEPLTEELDPLLSRVAGQVPAEYLEDVGIWTSGEGKLVAFFHTHQKNPRSGNIEDYGTLYELDVITGEITGQYEGYGADVYHANPVAALDDFIVDLHVNLHAPDPWGLYATGILGFVMLVAAISGLIMHRHLIKDVFLTPRNDNPAVKKRDSHVLAGTWSLLFSFILGFTGAFFSFASALGLPLVAVTAFGGDQVTMIETLVGVPEEEDKTPAVLAGIDAMKARSMAEAESIPTFISVAHWGRADAQVQIFHPPAEGKLTGSTHVFAGADGSYQGTKPQLGTEPSAGNTVYGLMAPLHFGFFAGLLSKIVWVCLGLVSCYVTASGMRLWIKRREKSVLWQRLGRTVDIVVYGTPIALAGAAHAFFIALPSAATAYWTAFGFLALAALTILTGWLSPLAALSNILKAGLGVLMLALPLTRLLTGGADWLSAIVSGNSTLVGVDLLLAGAGVVYLSLALGLPVGKWLSWPQTRTAH